jgi:hypothetical protein
MFFEKTIRIPVIIDTVHKRIKVTFLEKGFRTISEPLKILKH